MGAGSIFASLLSGAARGFAKEKTRQKLIEEEDKVATKKRVLAFATDVLNRPNIDSRLKQLAGAVVASGKPKDIKEFGEVMAQGGITVTEDVGSALPAAAPGGELPAIQTNQEGKIAKGQPQIFGLDEGPQIPGAPTDEARTRKVQTEEFLPLQESPEDRQNRLIDEKVAQTRAVGQVGLELADVAGRQELATRIDTNERVAISTATQAKLPFGSPGYNALLEAANNSALLNDPSQLNKASGFALNRSVPLADISALLDTFDTKMSGPAAVQLVKDTLPLEYSFAGDNVDGLILSQFAAIRSVKQNANEKKAYDLASSQLKFFQEQIKLEVLQTKQELGGLSRKELLDRGDKLTSNRDAAIARIASIQKSMEPVRNTLTGQLEPRSEDFLLAQEANVGMISLSVDDMTSAIQKGNDQLRELDGIEAAEELPDHSAGILQPIPAHRTADQPISLFNKFEESQRLINMEDVPMSNPEKFQLIANQMADMNDGEIFNFLGLMRFSDNPNEAITDEQRDRLKTAIKKAKQEGGSFFGRKFRPGVAQTE